MLSTASPYLVEDTMELCAKLGCFTTCSLDHNVSEIEGRAVESTSLRLNISARSKSPFLGRAYNIGKPAHYSGNVFCIEVENHNFLVERNGKIAFSGNSSANVFGAPKRNPVREDSPLAPRVPYDYSKVVGENMAMSFFESKRLPVTITRSWLLFGEHDQPTRATIRFIRACLTGEPITLYNGGKDKTAPSHAVNYARLVHTILNNEKAVGEAFNFGGERAVTVRQLAQTVKRLTQSNSELILAPPRTEMEKQPQISYPSTAKIKRLLGYKYELSLEKGLQRTIDWVRAELRQ
ncbi:MAG: GDP-mannose 4,6-dehydratase [Nitrososphaerota archaeon]|nr:GDP-mannose 4,6-dehydratase [Nitrososphaerota archaeon]